MRWPLTLLLVVAQVAWAETLVGKVVKVADGDTITILTADKKQHRIRVAGIDAPEKKQAFGNRSRQNLARLAHGKEARADCPKRDRYGRQVCKVWVDGQDVGLRQIYDGLAWWYRAYAREQSTEDRAKYEFEENQARLRMWGLKSLSSACAPQLMGQRAVATSGNGLCMVAQDARPALIASTQILGLDRPRRSK